MALRSMWLGLTLAAFALGAEPKLPETRLPAYTTIDRLPNGDTVTFAATGRMPAPAFRTGYFGMPVILAPYDPAGTEQALIFESSLYRFTKREGGFVLHSREALPEEPAEEHLSRFDASPGISDAMRENFARSERSINSGIGFQLDETGTLHWVGSTALFRFVDHAWVKVHALRPAFSSRIRRGPRAGLVVLPGRRIALFGGEVDFIEILELGSGPGEARAVKTIGYDVLGCDAESYPNRATPVFCVSDGSLFVYLRGTGRFYRMNLESYNLKEITVPWMQVVFARKGQSPRWTAANSSETCRTPQVPEAVAFALEADGSVHATALMFNMDQASAHQFTLDGQKGSIVSEFKLGEEIPDPGTYQDTKGDFVPLRGAKQVPDPEGGPLLNRP